jgi:DNA replication protein DnaC
MSVVAARCALCNGTGWIVDATSRSARSCHCQVDERKAHRIAGASIPKRYIHCTLADYYERGNPSLIRAKRRVAEFIDCWPSADRGLLLMGGCGVGKTHLAVAMLQEIINASKPGRMLYRNFQDLVQEIQASFSSDQSPSKSALLEPLIEADLLVLDELGASKPTPFVQDILYYIINSRYNEMKVTIFTTNYLDEPKNKGEERLEDRIGERLRSRLFEMAERVVLDSEDYRKSVAGRRV